MDSVLCHKCMNRQNIFWPNRYYDYFVVARSFPFSNQIALILTTKYYNTKSLPLFMANKKLFPRLAFFIHAIYCKLFIFAYAVRTSCTRKCDSHSRNISYRRVLNFFSNIYLLAFMFHHLDRRSVSVVLVRFVCWYGMYWVVVCVCVCVYEFVFACLRVEIGGQ